MSNLGYTASDPRLYLAGQLKQTADSFANELYDKSEEEATKERERALRQNYIERERSLRLLPQLNSAVGNTGGLAETSLINLASGYTEARSAIEAAYLSFIERARESLTSQIYQNNQSYLNTQMQIAATTPAPEPAPTPTPTPTQAPASTTTANNNAAGLNKIKEMIAGTTSKKNSTGVVKSPGFTAKKNIGLYF